MKMTEHEWEEKIWKWVKANLGVVERGAAAHVGDGVARAQVRRPHGRVRAHRRRLEHHN